MFVHFSVGRLHFGGRSSLKLSAVQGAILLGMALQYKTVDMLQVRDGVPFVFYPVQYSNATSHLLH